MQLDQEISTDEAVDTLIHHNVKRPEQREAGAESDQQTVPAFKHATAHSSSMTRTTATASMSDNAFQPRKVATLGLHAFKSHCTFEQRSGFLRVVPSHCSLPGGVSASLHSEPAPGL